MTIKELTDIQFDTYSKINNVDSIYQSSKYARVMQKHGYQPLLLGLFDNDTLVGASMVLIENKNGFKYAYVPRGFIIDFSNQTLTKSFTNYLKNYLKNKGVAAVKINPSIIRNKYNIDKNIIYHNENIDRTMNNLKELGYHHFGYNNNFEALKPRFEAILPLTKNNYQLFKNIKKNFRTKMRNAEKNGIVIHRGTRKNIEDLYKQTKNKYTRGRQFLTDIYTIFKEQEQADIYYAKLDTKQYLETIQQEYISQENICEKFDNLVLNSSNNFKNLTRKIVEDNKLAECKEKLKYATKLLRDHPEGIIIASVMIITNENTVSLFMDGYDTKYQTFNAKHLLLWKVIEKYAKLGYENFNLGGVTNILDSNKKYDGLNEFKLCFNPEVVEYIGDLELICNMPLYIMYQNSNKIKKLIRK